MAAQDEVDVCESWEDIDDIGLEKKINAIISAETSESQPSSAGMNGCRVVLDDNSAIGSPFMMQEPLIRILKRPSASGVSPGLGEARSRPVKTLEQRQKEYEEARLRIMGEARSPEDILDENITRIQEKLQANTITEPQPKPKLQQSPVALLAWPVPSQQPPPPGVLILRSPRGPDGTRGFSVRR